MKRLSFVFWIFAVNAFSQDGSVHTSKLSAEQSAIFNDVSEELICQCGCNLVLGSCGHINCPSAVPMRNTIEEMILAGKSKADMLDYFMFEYSFRDNPPVGKKILSQPGTIGFDMLAWTLPYVAFGACALFVILLVRRRSAVKPASPKSGEGTRLTTDEEQKIEEELKKIDL